MTTTTDPLDFLLRAIIAAPDDTLLTAALTRLGIVCGGRDDSEMCIAKFEGPLKAERGRLRLIEGLKKAKRIGA